VIEELDKEIELASRPGYRSRYDEAYGEPDHDVPPEPESGRKSERSDSAATERPHLTIPATTRMSPRDAQNLRPKNSAKGFLSN
jgi:hypothetical protein